MGGIGRWAALLVLGSMVSGCGFRPVYAPRVGEPDGSQAELETVRVAPASERAGQLVQEEMQARLDHGGAVAKRYELSVNMSVVTETIGVQRDTSTTRLRMTGTSNWTLRSLDGSHAIVTSGSARTLDGVNILNQQYFEVDLAGEAATRRIAVGIADQITLQLASYFARVAKAG